MNESQLRDVEWQGRLFKAVGNRLARTGMFIYSSSLSTPGNPVFTQLDEKGRHIKVVLSKVPVGNSQGVSVDAIADDVTHLVNDFFVVQGLTEDNITQFTAQIVDTVVNAIHGKFVYK